MPDFYCEQVLSGEIRIQKILETEHFLVFHHTRPAYRVHIVVIPKKHISSLLDIDESNVSLLQDMLSAIKQVAQQVVDEHDSCRVITNMGSYQDSKHLHWHVVSGKRLKE